MGPLQQIRFIIQVLLGNTPDCSHPGDHFFGDFTNVCTDVLHDNFGNIRDGLGRHGDTRALLMSLVF